MNTVNAMTIDVEDYFHVAALSKAIKPSEWEQCSSRVVRNTQQLLDIMDEVNVKGTFFILGWEAERKPELVKEIHRRGHEVASHGYSHQLVYGQTETVFREETRKSKQILEDLIQKPVVGYRAASYSITDKSLWALDILYELGFKYDSSIFPIRHDRYGIPDAKTEPHEIGLRNGGSIIEFPLTVASVFGNRLPIAGGGYFRIFPYWFFKRYFQQAASKGPAVFYLHPWEIDPGQPKVKTSMLSMFRHYRNLDKTEERLKNLLSAFSFTSMEEVLVRSGFLVR